MSASLCVFRSPLNEDVFTMPQGCDSRVTTPDVVQLSEKIHRLLVQPVHSGGSQGYSSLGSSGSRGSHRSRQQHLSASATSSSDSNSPAIDKAAAAVALRKPVSHHHNNHVTPQIHTHCVDHLLSRCNSFSDDFPADL